VERTRSSNGTTDISFYCCTAATVGKRLSLLVSLNNKLMTLTQYAMKSDTTSRVFYIIRLASVCKVAPGEYRIVKLLYTEAVLISQDVPFSTYKTLTEPIADSVLSRSHLPLLSLFT
jgi:hypothetical protein